MTTVNVDLSALEGVMWDSEKLDQMVEARAREINELAAGVYVAEARAEDLLRPSRDRPPSKYLDSFEVKKVRRRISRTGRLRDQGYSWLAMNTDPEALWVEIGAHAGGKTPVLKYRAYGRALDLAREKE